MNSIRETACRPRLYLTEVHFDFSDILLGRVSLWMVQEHIEADEEEGWGLE